MNVYIQHSWEANFLATKEQTDPKYLNSRFTECSNVVSLNVLHVLLNPFDFNPFAFSFHTSLDHTQEKETKSKTSYI